MKIRAFLATLAVALAAVAAAENFDDVVAVASSAGGTKIVDANPNRVEICLQNAETSIEYCAKGANVPTSTVYGFSLAPATGSGSADGGRLCFTGQMAIFKFTCLAATGTGKVARSTAGR